MKYKIGDKAKVREWDDMENEFGLHEDDGIKCRLGFETDMKEYCGTVVTICNAEKGFYLIEEDDGEWGWEDCMFE